ncbi:hypothetical protein [Candidatus Protochlamydia sp. R18]|uniref:hypothetical protein n=1 Tax=Candidatus Protochlamydia sp. R18 TaxID=1353977 RepID=UPI0005A675F4|nr:hypothetical protein [Candidatus Protochlamydia sp. R18]
MNNINSNNSHSFYSESSSQQEPLESINPVKRPRTNQKIPQEKPFLLKLIAIAQPIFKVLFQIFEFISQCACLLTKGLVSIKTKLTGIDLHIHLFTVVNVQQPYYSHMTHHYSENSLSV